MHQKQEADVVYFLQFMTERIMFFCKGGVDGRIFGTAICFLFFVFVF